VEVLGAPARPLSQELDAQRVGPQLFEQVGDQVEAQGRHELEARRASRSGDVRDVTDGASDTGTPAGHRLEEHARRGLARRAVHEDVELAQKGRHVGHA